MSHIYLYITFIILVFRSKKVSRKKAPNRLFIEDNPEEENSVAFFHPDKMEELGLFRGDTIRIKGKRRKVWILICKLFLS